MLKAEGEHSPPLSDRELGLIDRSVRLQQALQITMEYIEATLHPQLPPSIERFRPLLLDVLPEMEHVESVSARELLDVVTAMVRFLSETSSAELFVRHGLSGLADWTILMTLAFEPPGVTDRQITRIMGARYKRVQRLTQSLAESGLVSLRQVGTRGMHAVEITATGLARLQETNRALEEMLKWFTRRHRLRLMSAARSIRLLSRIYDQPSVKK